MIPPTDADGVFMFLAGSAFFRAGQSSSKLVIILFMCDDILSTLETQSLTFVHGRVFKKSNRIGHTADDLWVFGMQSCKAISASLVRISVKTVMN